LKGNVSVIIYSIYKIVNSVNGKVYIGYTKNFDKRLNEHKQDSKRFNTKFYKAIKKYGWNNFTHTILCQSLCETHIKELEVYFISEHNSYKKGYNSTLGGEGNNTSVSEATRKKQSISRGGRFAAKDNLGNTYQITKDDPRYISGELVGINKGVKASLESRKNQSIARMGNQHLLGHRHTEDSKRRISESLKKHYSTSTPK
jgi:group I intron endonuclease